MTSVLITAFEPYDRWQANSSWLTLVQSHAKPARASRPITTRLYPVDFAAVKEQLASDLASELRLRPAPGAGTRLDPHSVGIDRHQRGRLEHAIARSVSPAGRRADRSPIAARCRWAIGRCSCATRAFRRKSRITPARTCATRRFTSRATWPSGWG